MQKFCLVYSVILILKVDCRDKLAEEETEECCHGHYTYGDLGDRCFGTIGRCLTEILVLVSQAGGSVAYLIFIGQNLHSTFSQLMSPAGFIFAILLPLQIALSFIRSLSSLSPFSIFADVCNVLAMAIVIKEDLQLFDHPFSHRSAFNGLWAVPFTFGVAVFCFEGFSMTLALEASMAERRKFRWVLSQAVAAIITVYVCFGVCGYLAYGEATKDIITLNLPNNWSSAAVKVSAVLLISLLPLLTQSLKRCGFSEKAFVNQSLCTFISFCDWKMQPNDNLIFGDIRSRPMSYCQLCT